MGNSCAAPSQPVHSMQGPGHGFQRMGLLQGPQARDASPGRRTTLGEPLWGCTTEPWGQHCHPSRLERHNIKPKRVILQLSGLRFNVIGSIRLLVLLSSCLFLPFGNKMSILHLSPHCTLEAHYTFGFTGSQQERNLPQDESYLEFHSYLI